jgi:hypothetical protein
VLLAAVVVVGLIVSILRNPKKAFGYYRSKRNLVVLPLTFVGYMALQGFVWETHSPFWVALLTGILPGTIVVVGLRVFRRSPPAR